MASPENSITSCCMNDNAIAWVTAFGGQIYCNQSIISKDSAWNLIPGTLKQIVCSKVGYNWLAGINEAGEVYYATQNITTSPNWLKCSTAPPARFIALDDDGQCKILTKDNRMLSSNGLLSAKPPFNVGIALPSGVNANNIVSISAANDDWGIIVVNNPSGEPQIYVSKGGHFQRNNRPDWDKRVWGGSPFAEGAWARGGHIIWITTSGTIGYKTTWDNGNTLGTISSNSKFNHISFSNSNYFVATTRDNRVFWGSVSVINGENTNNLFDLDLSITNYIKANPYASLTSYLSNPSVGSASSLTESYIQKMAKKGITDFTPFKILSLYDLVMIGRAGKATWVKPFGDNGNTFDLWVLTFDDNDPYLPLGDVVVKSAQDIKKVLCVLIQNTDEFRTKINYKDYKYKNTSWDRGERNYTYTWNGGPVTNVNHRAMYEIMSAAKNTDSRNYGNTEQLVLGDVFSGGNINEGGDNKGIGNIYYRSIKDLYGNFFPIVGRSIKNFNTIVNNGNTNPNRPFAAVNPQFLAKVAGFDPTTNAVVDTYSAGNGYKDYWKIFPSSPYNTFMTGGGKNELINKTPGGYAYFEFLPEYLVAANCGNGSALTDLGITNQIQPIAQINCTTFMNTYLKKLAYKHVAEKPAYDWCGKVGSECDDNLKTFCSMGPGGKIYKDKDSSGVPSAKVPMTTTDTQLLGFYPNSKYDICGCFMPSDYGIAKDFNKLLTGMSAEDAKDFTTQMVAGKAYEIPGCYNSACATNKVNRQSWQKSPGGCRATQICMNKLTIENAGKITGNINVDQKNECSTSTTSGTSPAAPPAVTPSKPEPPPPPPPAPVNDNPKAPEPPPDSPKSNKTAMIIIITIILLMLMGGGYFIFLK